MINELDGKLKNICCNLVSTFDISNVPLKLILATSALKIKRKIKDRVWVQFE